VKLFNENVDRKNVIESLLFVAKKPISLEELSSILEDEISAIEPLMQELVKEYDDKALQIIMLANGYIMATRPIYSDYIEHYLNSPISVSLTNQSLEALSIIAYKQPVTRQDIENIRGVMSDGVVNTLLDKKLIKEAGKSTQIGHPMLYCTTVEFLKHFGLNDLSELPPLDADETTKSALSGIVSEQIAEEVTLNDG